MQIQALASDYDDSLAPGGVMSRETRDALERLKETGRGLLMVTGRELEDLKTTCPYVDIFDYIVAENGAVLYRPSDASLEIIAPTPSEKLIELLKAQNIPFSVGHSIIATRQPYEAEVIKFIGETGLEAHVIFNKGAVMVLPSGVNKGTGFLAALAKLNISPHNVIAIGDGENDHSFLSIAGLGVAVAHAVPALLEKADIRTLGGAGEGVQEIVDKILKDDKLLQENCPSRHWIKLGEGEKVASLSPKLNPVVILSEPGDALQSCLKQFTQALKKTRYQFCVMDLHNSFPETTELVVGTLKELSTLLSNPSRSVNFDCGKNASEIAVKLAAHIDDKGTPHYVFISGLGESLTEELIQGISGLLERSTVVLIVEDLSRVTDLTDRMPQAIIGIGALGERQLKDWCGSTEADLAHFTRATNEVLVWTTASKFPKAIVVPLT